jgi:predicted methyltransferase
MSVTQVYRGTRADLSVLQRSWSALSGPAAPDCPPAGHNVQSHLRVAVQETGFGAQRRTVYTQSGWREVGGRLVYLHAGGAIGAGGPVAGVEVELPRSLQPLRLPVPSTPEDEKAALVASLRLLDLATDPVTASLLGGVWRAPLGQSQLAVWVTGRTGAGKTELTALAQQHFGPGFDAQHLPAAWSGTANSIDEIAYLAKDTVLTVDDFVPKGPTATVAKLHATAEQVVRAQGNSAGRSRLNSDSELRASRPPQGTLIASGEDIPEGQSLRARLLVVNLAPGELDFTRLTSAQHDAATGVFATAMSGYLSWLARHPARLAAVPADTVEMRAQLIGTGSHNKTPSLLAEVALGWRTVLDYATDSRALTAEQADATWPHVYAALQICGAQQSEHSDADPTSRFVDLVVAALSSGRAHLAAVNGGTPMHAQRWGWRDDGTGVHPPWREQGQRIGWVEDDDIYLIPDATMKVVQTGSVVSPCR